VFPRWTIGSGVGSLNSIELVFVSLESVSSSVACLPQSFADSGHEGMELITESS